MGDKPTAAFVLSLIGAVLYLLVGTILAAVSSLIGGVADMAGYAGIGLGIAALGAVGLLSGVVMIIGSIMMNSSEKGRVRNGSIIVLIFTIVGALFTLGGFGIGFILALIGSILGLTWKPSTVAPPPPAPTM